MSRKRSKARRQAVSAAAPAPRALTAMRALGPPLLRCARHPDNAWLFVFLPALCVCVALSKWHFAPKALGTLEGAFLPERLSCRRLAPDPSSLPRSVYFSASLRLPVALRRSPFPYRFRLF